MRETERDPEGRDIEGEKESKRNEEKSSFWPTRIFKRKIRK